MITWVIFKEEGCTMTASSTTTALTPTKNGSVHINVHDDTNVMIEDIRYVHVDVYF